MNIDFKNKNAPDGPVVFLDHLDVEQTPTYDTGMSDVSFRVNRGELVLVKWNRV